MPYEEVTEPIQGPDVFGMTENAAILSQAAVLLLLGVQLRGDDYSLESRAMAVGVRPFMEAIPKEDQIKFPVPRLITKGERISFDSVKSALLDNYPNNRSQLEAVSSTAGERLPDFPHEVGNDVAKRLYQEPNLSIAAQLLELYLHHPDTLLQVAAATSYFDISADPSRLIQVLVNGTLNDEELVYDVAVAALARIAPDNQRLLELAQSTFTEDDGSHSQTSLLIHGTLARGFGWWKPGGDFHSYIQQNCRPDLYDGSDWVGWNGGYSNAARTIGANELHDFIAKKNWSSPNLFTHSHGGSIAMLASHRASLPIGELVMLSCPVHAHKYMPNFTSVQKVVSIRVHLDLAILADRGGQRFWHPNIHENVLPIWFDHGATHKPDIWRKHNVYSML